LITIFALKGSIPDYNLQLHDNQFAALVSFTFNMGGGALQRSILRQKVNYGLNKEAGREFLRWVYAGGKRLQGLVLRRSVERNLFLLDI
jgi:lysozyme